MKFSIQEVGGDKQIFFTFKEASEKTGIPSKMIVRVLNSERNKYFRRSDKKSFWIQNEESSPFAQIDGEDFFTAEEVQERFGLSRTVLFNQLGKKKTHFLDSQEKSHEVTWKSDDLEKFLSKLREIKVADEKYFYDKAKTGLPKVLVESKAKLKQSMDDFFLA